MLCCAIEETCSKREEKSVENEEVEKGIKTNTFIVLSTMQSKGNKKALRWMKNYNFFEGMHKQQKRIDKSTATAVMKRKAWYWEWNVCVSFLYNDSHKFFFYFVWRHTIIRRLLYIFNFISIIMRKRKKEKKKHWVR